MNDSLIGKKVVITGAASGIGRGLALGFAEQGASVLGLDVNEVELDQLREEAQRKELQIDTHPTDVTVADDLQMAFQLQPSRCDVFVHCAGVTVLKSLTNTTSSEYRRLVETNITGTFNALKTAVDHMRDGAGGSIIVIGSINSQWPLSNQAVYTATKAAIEAMAKCLAVEVAPFGVRVNVISPGAIDTPLNANLEGDRRTALANRIPLARIGVPKDILGTALFLSSPWSDYLTGATIVVDGGFVISR